MKDEKIRDVLHSIRNRCTIAMFLLELKMESEQNLPQCVYDSVVTILEDICQDYQTILEKCTAESWDKS